MAVVTSVGALPKLSQVKKEIESKTNAAHPMKEILVKLDKDEKLPAGFLTYEDMVSDRVTTDSEIHSTRRPDDVAIFSYSSGTTGLPKAVQLTHKNIVSNILQSADSNFGYVLSTTSECKIQIDPTSTL